MGFNWGSKIGQSADLITHEKIRFLDGDLILPHGNNHEFKNFLFNLEFQEEYHKLGLEYLQAYEKKMGLINQRVREQLIAIIKLKRG